MKKQTTTIAFLVVWAVLLFAGVAAFGQANGDYRSVTTGNWSSIGTWETYDGATWNAATGPPGSTANVFIEDTHTVTVDVGATINNLNLGGTSGTRLAISSSITLQINGILRNYTGAAPGMDSGSPSQTIITTASGGKLQITGTTRNITTSMQWGAATRNFTVEFALDAGATGTLGTAFKAGDVIVASGELICNSDLRADFNSAGTGTITVKSGATLRMGNNSDIKRVNTASNTSHISSFTLESGGILEYRQGVGSIGATTISLNGKVTYNSTSPQTLVTKGANSGGADPNTYTDLTISNTGTRTLGLNTTVNGILELRTATGGTPVLYLGTFTFTYGTSATLQYRGIGSPPPAQTTTDAEWPTVGSGLSMPPNVDIFNASTVTLNSHKAITGELKLSGAAGITQQLILGGNNLSVGSIYRPVPDEFKYIVTNGTGALSMSVGAGATKDFPIGASSSSYDPVSVTPAGATTMSARVKSGFTVAPPIPANAVGKEWDITSSAPGSTSLSFTPSDPIATSSPVVGHYNTSTMEWEELSATRSGNTWTCTTSSFSPFGVGQATAFPITLASFHAKPLAASVLLEWRTASEQNNDYMAVERSTDGIKFEEIGRLPGKGSTSEPQYYRLEDRRPAQGINYYRLRQADYDGTLSFSDVQSVLFRGEGKKEALFLYPTLLSLGEMLQIDLRELPADELQIDIVRTDGSWVASHRFSGGGVVALPTGGLSQGVYLVRLNGAHSTAPARFVVKSR